MDGGTDGGIDAVMEEVDGGRDAVVQGGRRWMEG